MYAPETEQVQPASPELQKIAAVPLVVDLDGTLLKTDLLFECLLALLKQSPHHLIWLPIWLLRGRAHLKDQVAKRVSLDVSTLPYRRQVLEYIDANRGGRKIVLATAASIEIAQHVADYLKCFDEVIASNGVTNLKGENKRQRLASEFGERGFDYAGNDTCDLEVWASSRNAILINPGRRVRSKVSSVANIECVLNDSEPGALGYVRALRLHQWLKNVLVFAPLFAYHLHTELTFVLRTCLAFLALGCFASGGYLINDLLDLEADRHHPQKRYRPFASGAIPLSFAVVTIPPIVAAGCLIAAFVSPLLVSLGLLYFGLSVTYSLYWKRTAILDVMVLAGLYTLRVIAGFIATGTRISQWLLAVSMFLFFSLALVKRYSELVTTHAGARGYEIGDRELLAAMGLASGYSAIVVLALFVNTAVAHALYRRCEALWLLCPLLLYWVSHIWLSAYRGKVMNDPVVFAVANRTSRTLIFLMLATGLIAL